MKMADEVKAPAAAKAAKGYKLAKGHKLDLPKIGIKVSDEDLKNPNIVALILRKCPEVFGVSIIPA